MQKEIMKDEGQQVSKRETEKLLNLAESALGIEGDFVELGCYRGDTSLLLQKLLEVNHSNKKLWIYDSFAGLPQKTKEDLSVAGDEFKEKELFVSKREVVERFKKAGLNVPIVKKGFFENLNSGKDFPNKISFAFLDGDLYSSIKTSLKLVIPKLDQKGIILVHDYNNPKLPGSSRAVDEFLKNHSDFHLTVFETIAKITR